MITMLITVVNLFPIQEVFSQTYKTTVVLYVEGYGKNFKTGQQVKLAGQVIYHTPEGGTGVGNVYYEIIDKDSGAKISSGYTDYDGTFSYNWIAEKGNKNTRNLQAIFFGSGGYGYAESNTLTINIYGDKDLGGNSGGGAYHSTSLSLQISEDSDYISVYPELTYGSGLRLDSSESVIDIYVDGQYKTSVIPNQWSSNIYVGYGYHEVYAKSVELVNNANRDKYSPTTSYTKDVALESRQTTHNANLHIELQKGSEPDSIQVYPELTYDSGTKLSSGYTIGGTSEFIKIYVNGQYKTSVIPNQWSSDIYVGYGYHEVSAESPHLTDSASDDTYLATTSNIASIDLPNPSTTTTSTTATTQSANTDPTIFIILGAVAAIGAGVGVAIMKRKKPVVTPKGAIDDTQIW
jgi:hypothetical protein